MQKEMDYQAIGIRIRAARERKGFSQERLSEACSLSPSHIGHVERGTRVPSLETMFAIACALDIGLDELVFGFVAETESLFSGIASTLQRTDSEKVSRFMSTVQVLSAHIDEI